MSYSSLGQVAKRSNFKHRCGTSAHLRFCCGNLFDQRIDTGEMLRGTSDDQQKFGIVLSEADYTKTKTSLERLLACVLHIVTLGQLARDGAHRLEI
jgi:hypothetical protein